jgi:predicted nucleotidyltransferase
MEAIMIGNAAAALQGAPVSTVDVDFFFRKTPANLRKLKAVARAFGGTILRPYYPVSSLFRMAVDDESVQLDFMATIHGARSCNSVKSRAICVDIGGEKILVAALSDITASKRAANRPRDRSVIDALSRTLKEQKTVARRETKGTEAGK